MLTYLVHCDEQSGRWHVCYRVPGTDALASVADCPSQHSAADERIRIIRQAEREHRELERVFDQNRKFLPRRFNNEHDD